MPMHINILENKVLGPPFKKGLEQGRQDEAFVILRRLLEKRFGRLRFGQVKSWQHSQSPVSKN